MGDWFLAFLLLDLGDGMPSLDVLKAFPGPQHADAQARHCREWAAWYYARMHYQPWQFRQQHLDAAWECREMAGLWETLAESHSQRFSDDVRRQNLDSLRRHLGDVAFGDGKMPPAVTAPPKAELKDDPG